MSDAITEKRFERPIIIETTQGKMIYSDKKEEYEFLRLKEWKGQFQAEVSDIKSFGAYVYQEMCRRSSDTQDISVRFNESGAACLLEDGLIKGNDKIYYKRKVSPEWKLLENYRSGPGISRGRIDLDPLIVLLTHLRFCFHNDESYKATLKKFMVISAKASQTVSNVNQAGTLEKTSVKRVEFSDSFETDIDLIVPYREAGQGVFIKILIVPYMERSGNEEIFKFELYWPGYYGDKRIGITYDVEEFKECLKTHDIEDILTVIDF